MNKLGNFFQSADWKAEKHVPVIECPESVKKGEKFIIKASVGKEIAHPNTTEHHIRWIQVFFKPADELRLYQIINYEFSAHGESVDGPNKGPVFSEPFTTATVSITKAGTLHALSYCNIHGLWENAKDVTVS
jgi:superoxide reductase